jgi:predicted ATPase
LKIEIQEKYNLDKNITESFLSSGSISLISIIVALFFENKKISIFEEPARRVHPFLISMIIKMMQEAAEKTQIFLTTHNPEIVKYAELEDIFYLYRDKSGFSVISKISEKPEIAEFLKNEIGLEELFVQNLLNK